MNKHSESFNIARHQYIKGYQDKNEHIFPTLDFVAKEFSLTLSTLRKKAANEGWYKKRKQYQNVREEYEMREQFKGKYSKLAQISRNTLVLVEYFQTEIHKEILKEKNGKMYGKRLNFVLNAVKGNLSINMNNIKTILCKQVLILPLLLLIYVICKNVNANNLEKKFHKLGIQLNK